MFELAAISSGDEALNSSDLERMLNLDQARPQSPSYAQPGHSMPTDRMASPRGTNIIPPSSTFTAPRERNILLSEMNPSLEREDSLFHQGRSAAKSIWAQEEEYIVKHERQGTKEEDQERDKVISVSPSHDYEEEEEEHVAQRGEKQKKKFSNRNASKRYRARQKQLKENLAEENAELRVENAMLRKELALLKAERQGDLRSQLELLRAESLRKLEHALGRGASALELETLVLQLQNKSDIDSDTRATLFRENTLDSVECLLPGYARFALWALDHTASFRARREATRLPQSASDAYDLDQMLDLHFVAASRASMLDNFRSSLSHKKAMLEEGLVDLSRAIERIVHTAGTFKEEFEQMRGLLQPWQVARLILDIERLKGHRQLRLAAIFKLPPVPPLHSALRPRTRSPDAPSPLKRPYDFPF